MGNIFSSFIHPSSIFKCFIMVRVSVEQKPIPGTLSARLEHTLDVHHRSKTQEPIGNSCRHTTENMQKLYREKPELRIKPWILVLWGGNATFYTTVPLSTLHPPTQPKPSPPTPPPSLQLIISLSFSLFFIAYPGLITAKFLPLSFIGRKEGSWRHSGFWAHRY